jgi:hypothetical protein
MFDNLTVRETIFYSARLVGGSFARDRPGSCSRTGGVAVLDPLLGRQEPQMSTSAHYAGCVDALSACPRAWARRAAWRGPTSSWRSSSWRAALTQRLVRGEGVPHCI